jgi:hypothetical protein
MVHLHQVAGVSLPLLVSGATLFSALEFGYRALWIRRFSEGTGKIILRWIDFPQTVIAGCIARHYLGNGLLGRAAYIGVPLLVAVNKAFMLAWIPLPDLARGDEGNVVSLNDWVGSYADKADHYVRLTTKVVNFVSAFALCWQPESRSLFTPLCAVALGIACLKDIVHTRTYFREWSNSYFIFIYTLSRGGKY